MFAFAIISTILMTIIVIAWPFIAGWQIDKRTLNNNKTLKAQVATLQKENSELRIQFTAALKKIQQLGG